MRSISPGGTRVERTVLIRLRLWTPFFWAAGAVLAASLAALFGFVEPTDRHLEMLGPVGRTIFAVGIGLGALFSLVALVGVLVTRLEFAVAYGDHTLFMPWCELSPAYWMPWRRGGAMVSIDLRNATLETCLRPLGMGESQVGIVISSGNTRVEAWLTGGFSWDEDDMWRRWGEFHASLHGVDMDSLPPNALRPDKSTDQVALEEIIRKDKRYWNGYMLVGLLALLVFWLLFLVLENPL